MIIESLKDAAQARITRREPWRNSSRPFARSMDHRTVAD
jgi:hypothetical protein